jgi:hypothetical protein
VLDVDTGAVFIGGDIGNFESDTWQKNVPGGSAATVIDRMGGIAYWGSSSHHLTMGYGYSPRKSAARIFAGHTLGDALFMGTAMSGIAYGDPLYRAYGTSIRTLNHDKIRSKNQHAIFPNTPEGSDALWLDVLQGTSALDSVRWSLDSCKGDDVIACDGAWSRQLDGVGAIDGSHLSFDKMVELLPTGEPVVLKLHIWRPDRPEDHLTSYAFVSVYEEDWVVPEGCQYDINDDGKVNGVDTNLVEPHAVCTTEELAFDLNNDGWVGVDDLAIIIDVGFVDDPIYDFTGDGKTDLDDWNELTYNYCGAPKPPAGADANDDGAIDALDLALIESYSGVEGCHIPGSGGGLPL